MSGFLMQGFDLRLKDEQGQNIREGNLLTSSTVHLFEEDDIRTRPCTVVWWGELACFALELDERRVPMSDVLRGWNPTVFKIVIGTKKFTP